MVIPGSPLRGRRRLQMRRSDREFRARNRVDRSGFVALQLRGCMLVYGGEGRPPWPKALPAACLSVAQAALHGNPRERCDMPENATVTPEALNCEPTGSVENRREWALSDERSPTKSRILMGLALDASHGDFESAASLAEAAAEAGASTEEITEALGVKQFTGEVSRLHTSAKALGVLQEYRRRHDRARVG